MTRPDAERLAAELTYRFAGVSTYSVELTEDPSPGVTPYYVKRQRAADKATQDES